MQVPDDLTLDDLDQVTINTFYSPDVVAMRLGLMCTLYVQHPHDPAVKQALARCGDQYQAMFGEYLTLYRKPTGSGKFARYPAKGVSLAKYLETNNLPDRPFAPSFTSGTRYEDATSYSLSIWAPSAEYFPGDDAPAFFTATVPFAFLKDHSGEGAFQHLVHGWCKILQPYCGYAGIGAIQSVDSTEKLRTVAQVYPIAVRFPGVEIENASIVSLHINSHIKSVNWLTALSDEALGPIGGRAALLGQLDENFRIMEYEGGVLIQSGRMPQLGDANRGQAPRYYRQLSELVRPLRMRFPDGHSFIRSGGQQSGAEATNEWLARFD
ncbi:MAG TPA: type VI immunity family protein [Gemmatimonadaceae bacterium]